MEYVLLGALFLGILLFALGWLMVAVAGFQRHPLTGIFTLIPVLNVITLPSLWHKVSVWVITGFVGVSLAIGAWMGGAKTHLYQQAQVFGANIAVTTPPAATEPAPTAAAPVTQQTLALPTAAQTTQVAQATAPAAPVAPVQTAAPVNNPPTLPPTEDLPQSALYRITFKNIPTSGLVDNNGNYARLTQKDGHHREGKIQNATATEVTLEERREGKASSVTIKNSDIREAFIMDKQQGDK
jgi:hypothetical protein